MRPRSLTIQGFKSYRKKELLKFPFDPYGFYLVTGENLLAPELGPNATGKTSLWSAICWVLFAKTDRGLRGQAVANWGMEYPTSVKYKFDIGDSVYELRRTWKPNGLTLRTNDGEPRVIEQKELEDLIRMNWETFLSVVLMGQFNQFFFDLSPADKLQIFNGALNLEVWMDASKAATLKARTIKAKVDELSSKVSELRGSLMTLKAQSQELDEAYRAEAKERDKQIAEWTKIVDDAKAEEAADSKKFKKVIKDWHHFEDSAKDLTARLVKLSKRLNERKEKYLAALSDLKHSTNDVQSIKGQLKQAPDLSRCPTCGQKVTKDHVDHITSEYATRLDWCRGERAKIKVITDEAHDLYAASQEKFNRLSEKLNRAEDRHEALNKERLRLQMSMSTTGARGDSAALKIKIAMLRPKAMEEDAKKIKGQIASVRQQLTEAKELLTAAQSKLQRYEYWATGFKDVRLWLVETALRELEVEVNNGLIQLGLKGWKVTFDIERENASGGVSRGFSVFIQSPESGTPVAWESWSGGETQRLRIAGAVGLSNLICHRRQISPTFEVWDEPTAHMTEQGIEDMLRFFETRTRRESKQIWLVDHRSISYGGFDGNVRITIDNEGSHISAKFDK